MPAPAAPGVPEEVLAALDRLNGHARAWGFGREAIYAYKTLAALVAALAGQATARPVSVEARCTACSGTGLWWDVDPQYKSSCRRCRRTGRVTLRFVETAIGAHRWHHPWLEAGMSVLRAAWQGDRIDRDEDGVDVLLLDDGGRRPMVWEGAGDWAPNRGGERLEAEAAAALLNLVEAWAQALTWAPAGFRPAFWWKREAALQALRDYRLDLGRAPGPCCLCGSEAVTHALGFMPRHRPLLQWSRPVCDGHRGLHPSEWPKDLPEELIGPAVRAWIENPARAA